MSNSRRNRRPNKRTPRGFSLIEVLVAMTIFALITVATGFALTTVLRTQASMRVRAEMLQEIRGIAAVLRRDVRAAYASENNPNTMFMSGGDVQGALLTFSALTGRVEWSEQPADGEEEEEIVSPQSDLRTVTYAHDPQSGMLSRIESAVPGTDATAMAGSMAGSPETILSRRVANIAIEYYDMENQQIRQEWAYTNDPELQQSGVESDTSLPASVHVELELADKNGFVERHTLVISLATPTPAPAGQAPAAATTPTTGGSRQTAAGSRQWAAPIGQRRVGSSERRSLPGLEWRGAR